LIRPLCVPSGTSCHIGWVMGLIRMTPGDREM
jgi:hypothetical protein